MIKKILAWFKPKQKDPICGSDVKEEVVTFKGMNEEPLYDVSVLICSVCRTTHNENGTVKYIGVTKI
jgi:hypothetical protein